MIDDNDIEWEDDIEWEPAAPAPKPSTLGTDRGRWPERLVGIARAGAQGVTMGAADEIEAGLTTLGSVSPSRATYEKRLREIRGANAEMREVFPKATAGLELAGSAAPALLTRGRAKPVAVGAAPVAGKFKQILANTGVGAASGAVAGFNTNEGDLYQRLNAGLQGGIVGGVTGGAMTGGIQLASRTGKLLSDAFRGKLTGADLRRRVDDEINLTLERDGGLNQAQLKLAENRKAGVSGDTLMDVSGPNMAGRGASVATSPGPGRTTIDEALIARQQRQGEALVAHTNRATGVPRQDTNALTNEIVDRQRAQAKDAYAAAYAQPPVRDPRVAAFMQRPEFARAWRTAQRYAANEGDKINLQDPFTVENLDRVKRAMNDAVEARRDSITGRLTSEGQMLSKQTRAFTDLLDENVPEYRNARAIFAGDYELRQAIRAGRSALSASDDDWREMAGDFAQMTAAEKGMVRRGLVDDIALQLERRSQAAGGKTPDLTSLLTSTKSMERLRALIPTPAAFEEFKKAVAARARQSEVNRIVRTGSPTAARLAEKPDITTNEATSAVFTGQPIMAAVGWAGRQLNKALGGQTDEVTAELAKALTLNGPQLTLYLQSLGPAKAAQLTRQMTALRNKRAVAVAAAQNAVTASQPPQRGGGGR